LVKCKRRCRKHHPDENDLETHSSSPYKSRSDAPSPEAVFLLPEFTWMTIGT
jgi:hypothetical protein